MFCKKRKAFDSTKQRVVDTDQKLIAKKSASKPSKIKKVKNADWKKQSEQLRSVISAARSGKSAPTVVDKSLIKCKFCKRRFKEEVAERHIKFCEHKYKENKIKQTPDSKKEYEKKKKAISHYGRVICNKK